MQKDNQQNMQRAYKQGQGLANNLIRQFNFLNNPTSFSSTEPPPNIHPNILHGYTSGLSLAQNIFSTQAAFCNQEPSTADLTEISNDHIIPPQAKDGLTGLSSIDMLINFENLKKAINQEITQMLPPDHSVDEDLLELSVEDQAEKYNYTKQQIEEFAQNLMETDLQFKRYVAIRNNHEEALGNLQDIQLKSAPLQLALPATFALGLLGFAWMAYHNYVKDLKEYRGITSIDNNILERARVSIVTKKANVDITSKARSIAKTKNIL